MSFSKSAIAVTGMGVVTAIGHNVAEFRENLFQGCTSFSRMHRAGHEQPGVIGAEIRIDQLPVPKTPSAIKSFGLASLSQKTAILAIEEAWIDANLSQQELPPHRIGLVVGGGQVDLRELQQLREEYQARLKYLRPSYGVSIWETQTLGLIAETFDIHGEGLTVGGASAAGTMAIIHGFRQLQAGVVDACIVVAPMCDLSRFEIQALRSLGAMGSDRFADVPEQACRPFDTQSDGFILGEGCGAMILQRKDSLGSEATTPRAWLLGCGVAMSATKGPRSDTLAQQRAIELALKDAELLPEHIDYINTHGTGSPHGDAIELESIRNSHIDHCVLNSTKSLTGHCLTAAGMVESIATILQLQAGRCHGTRNLNTPIDSKLRWASNPSAKASINTAMKLSFAFGGLNCGLVIGSHSEVINKVKQV